MAFSGPQTAGRILTGGDSILDKHRALRSDTPQGRASEGRSMCYTVSSIDDVRELVTTIRHVSAYMDPAKMAATACGALHALLETDVTAIALLDESRTLSMQCVWGAGEEFTELIAASELGDLPSALAARVVRLPGFHGNSSSPSPVEWAIGQPVVFSGETIAVLYAAQRADRMIDDRVVALLCEFSASVAPIIAMSLRAERAGARARREERRRI